MKINTSLVVLLLIGLTSTVFAIRVGVINDLHLDPFYDPSVESDRDCRGLNPFKLKGLDSTNDLAPFGRYGCDVSPTLINILFAKLKELSGHIDVLLVSGDFTGHDIAAKRGKADENYIMLKSVISSCFAQYIDPSFSKTIIIPTIGNNDAKFHYEFPQTGEEADEYYGFLYDLWWNEIGANPEYSKKDEVKETFMKGGFYRYDHSDKISFLALNSLYWSEKNEKFSSSISHSQLDWLEEQLRDAEDSRQFIINMHIFPGMYNPGARQRFWLDEFTNRFDDIMLQYGHKVILFNGAHVHIADVRASWVEDYGSVQDLLKDERSTKRAYFANFVSPAISPVYLNNPGFSMFDIEEDEMKVHNITAHFLELDRTFQSKGHEVVFHSIDFAEEFGIDEWSPQTILDFMDRAQNDDELFKRFLILKLGFRLDQEEEALTVYENLNMIDFSNNNRIYWCFFQYMRAEDYDACVKG